MLNGCRGIVSHVRCGVPLLRDGRMSIDPTNGYTLFKPEDSFGSGQGRRRVKVRGNKGHMPCSSTSEPHPKLREIGKGKMCACTISLSLIHI